jgi:hypothetical protein
MDNCSAHLLTETILLLSDYQVKAITFPPHSSGGFLMFHLVFFGVLKQMKKRAPNNPELPAMTDYAMRMHRADESAAVSRTIWRSFQHVSFTYEQVPAGRYVLRLNENKVRAVDSSQKSVEH